jgi:hypothetical protein
MWNYGEQLWKIMVNNDEQQAHGDGWWYAVRRVGVVKDTKIHKNKG